MDNFDLDAALKATPKGDHFDLDAVLSASRAPAPAPSIGKRLFDLNTEAVGISRQLPGAIASVYGDYAAGALKGLGGIADTAMEAVGIPRSDYADAAFEPSNPVQSVGKGAAQMGSMVLASEAALAGLGLSPLGSLIAKFITSPVGAGATQTGVEMAQGVAPGDALKHGAVVAAGVKLAPAAIQAIGKMFPKATPQEVNVAAQEAKAFLEASRAKMAARDARTPVLPPAPLTGDALRDAHRAAYVKPANPVQALPPNPAPVMPSAHPQAPVMPSAPPAMAQAMPEAPPGAPPMPAPMPPQAPPVAEIRPIPPQKLPPVLPDPVVPELAVKPSGAGQNARDWLQKYSDAGKGGTKEEIAAARAKLMNGLSGKLSYEDMRQLGAYTDDIATVNPGAPPEAVTTRFRPVKLEDVPRPVAEAPKPAPPVSDFASAKPEAIKALVENRFTEQPALIDRIGKAVSPQAAYDDLRKHAGFPDDMADEAVSLVWKQKDPSYQSRSQWMKDRAAKQQAEIREARAAEKAPSSPSVPMTATFDEYSASMGIPSKPPSFPEYHRAAGGVSKPSSTAAAKRVESDLAEWQSARDKVRAEYDSKVLSGEIVPPSAADRLRTVAQGDGEQAEAARRVIEKRQARLKDKPGGELVAALDEPPVSGARAQAEAFQKKRSKKLKKEPK